MKFPRDSAESIPPSCDSANTVKGTNIDRMSNFAPLTICAKTKNNKGIGIIWISASTRGESYIDGQGKSRW